MKAIVPITILCSFILCMGVLHADVHGFYLGTEIYDSGIPLTLNSRSAPIVVDWNSDGKRDLLIGNGWGYVFVYLNQGTDLDPLFNGAVYLKSDGAPLQVDPTGT